MNLRKIVALRLLIVPEGIEIKQLLHTHWWNLLLLIVPEGIEIIVPH